MLNRTISVGTENGIEGLKKGPINQEKHKKGTLFSIPNTDHVLHLIIRNHFLKTYMIRFTNFKNYSNWILSNVQGLIHWHAKNAQNIRKLMCNYAI